MAATASFGAETEHTDNEAIAHHEDSVASEIKPVRLSLHLIVKRHLPKDANTWPQDKIISELNKIKRVRLDRENIGEIDSLELFSTQVTNLYLQSNKICIIQNLECLPNLQVLVLSNNQITNVTGMDHLEKLLFLDLSENCIGHIDCDNIPKGIIILNLSGNSSLDEKIYRPQMIQHLPKLKQLDGEGISVKDKIEAGVLSEWDEMDIDTDSEASEEEQEEERQRSFEGASTSSTVELPLIGGEPDVEILPTSHYTQLPKIESSIQGLAADMLLRSQQRLEDVARQHKSHLQQITNIRIKSKIRPIPQISKPE